MIIVPIYKEYLVIGQILFRQKDFGTNGSSISLVWVHQLHVILIYISYVFVTASAK